MDATGIIIVVIMGVLFFSFVGFAIWYGNRYKGGAPHMAPGGSDDGGDGDDGGNGGDGGDGGDGGE